MTPDRHLGAAWIDRCRPDLLITESTYATTIRDSKRCRERDFLSKVHDCIDRGGKWLIKPCHYLRSKFKYISVSSSTSSTSGTVTRHCFKGWILERNKVCRQL